MDVWAEIRGPSGYLGKIFPGHGKKYPFVGVTYGGKKALELPDPEIFPRIVDRLSV